MAKIIEIDTERLRLRQWRAADRQPFATLNTDPEVMEFYPSPLNRAASDAMANRHESLIAERGWGLWAVELKETCEFMGFVGLHIPTVKLPFSPCVEVCWRIALRYWGKGLASEAARSSLQVGFEFLGLPEIVSFTTIRNLRSRAVMERLGMLNTGETFGHPDVPAHSVLSKHCLYRLSRQQWMIHVE